MLLEKTIETPLDCKEIKPVNPKGNHCWIFIGKTGAEAEAPVLWPPDEKNWLIWKDPDAGKDWRQEEKGKSEDEMVGWHHWLNGHEFEQAPGDSERQGRLALCSPLGHKESDMTEWLNNNFAHTESYDRAAAEQTYPVFMVTETTRICPPPQPLSLYLDTHFQTPSVKGSVSSFLWAIFQVASGPDE